MAIKKYNRGFALLIAVIFMAAMLSIGLALSSLGYKQQLLASTSLASAAAFYAADAGLECALYADQQQGSFNISGGNPSLTCDGQTLAIATSTSGTNVVGRVTVPFENNTLCATVTVYKPTLATDPTYVFSEGYSTSCATFATDIRATARGISVSY